MPNPFRVGDRVRRIGIPDYVESTIPNGSIWVVSEIVNGFSITVENDPNPMNSRNVRYFELVEPPVVAERVHTCYIIVYQFGQSVRSTRRDSEQAATREAERIIRDGGTVLAKKKITVRY